MDVFDEISVMCPNRLLRIRALLGSDIDPDVDAAIGRRLKECAVELARRMVAYRLRNASSS